MTQLWLFIEICQIFSVKKHCAAYCIVQWLDLLTGLFSGFFCKVRWFFSQLTWKNSQNIPNPPKNQKLLGFRPLKFFFWKNIHFKSIYILRNEILYPMVDKMVAQLKKRKKGLQCLFDLCITTVKVIFQVLLKNLEIKQNGFTWSGTF